MRNDNYYFLAGCNWSISWIVKGPSSLLFLALYFRSVHQLHLPTLCWIFAIVTAPQALSSSRFLFGLSTILWTDLLVHENLFRPGKNHCNWRLDFSLQTPTMSLQFLRVAVLLYSIFCTFSLAMPEYGQKYSGKATYYGTPPMAPNTHTHCHLPNNLMGMRTIAMNKVQYDLSRACGMCVRVHGSGAVCANGIDPGDNSCGLGADPIAGTFEAVVTDELWERGYGDIDLGRYGDGYWPVSWEPIPCPWDPKPAVAIHEGATSYYAKIQMRYLDSPMESMELNGVSSTWRYHDNFFVFFANSNNKLEPQADGFFYIKARTVLGKTYCGKFDSRMQAEPYEYSAWAC